MRVMRNAKAVSSRLRRVAIGICTVVLIASCSANGVGDTTTTASPPGSTSDTGAPNTQPPGVISEAEIRVVVNSIGTQDWTPWLNPSEEQQVVQHIGDTLLKIDPATQQISAGLVESWELSDDQTTWTFRLRPDVQFHDGWGTLTSEDVKFTWEMYIREDSLQTASAPLRAAVDGDIDNFRIISDLEFSVTAPQQSFLLPSELTDAVTSMLVHSADYWAADPEEAAAHPIGTGPFKFVASTPGVEVRLEAFEDYWGDPPSFRYLTFRIVQEEASRLAQVLAGDADLAPIPPRLIGEAETQGLRVLHIPDVGSLNLILGGLYPDVPGVEDRPDHPGLDCDSPWVQCDNPERGLAVRKALALAINTEGIRDALMGGFGDLTVAPLVHFPANPELNDSRWEVPAHNPQLASQMIAEAGYPDGFEITMVLYEQGGRPGCLDVAEVVATQFEAIGLTVNRQPTDHAVWRPAAEARATQGWIYCFINPWYQEAYRTFVSYGPWGAVGHFYHEKVNEVRELLSLEPDQSERYAITRDFINTMYEEAWGAIPMFTYGNHYVASDRILDWTPTPGVPNMTRLQTLVLGDG